MMKKILSVALLSALSTTAMAEGLYAAIDVGQSTNKDVCVGVPAGVSCNESGTAFRFGGGYQFTPNLGVEVNYGLLASSKASDGVTSAEVKPTALQVAATGTFPIADAFSLIGKLGIARTSADFSATGFTSTSTTSTKLAYGIGAQYDLSKTIGVRAQYESLGEIADPNAVTTYKTSMISAGAVFKF